MKKAWKASTIMTCGLLFASATATGLAGTVTSQAAGKKVTIALLLPQTVGSPRYETQDKPDFTAEVTKLDSNATVLYNNAQDSTSTQLQQAESALTNGANVLVVDPVDGVAAASIVAEAAKQNVPVIAYDRMISNAKISYYVSFNNLEVGKLQGKWIADHTKKGGTIVMINGAQTDPNALQFRQGALDVLQPLFKSGKLKLGYWTYTPNWDPTNGLNEMTQALTKLGNKVNGVLSANDNLAGAVVQALTGAHLNPKNIPITGQDATDAGLNRIYYQHTQSMTIYKAVPKEADAAAQLAVALATGSKVPSGLVNSKMSNGAEKVPSVLLKPEVVTRANIKSTVIKDGYTTWKKIKNPGASS